jgi:hypothetical protein
MESETRAPGDRLGAAHGCSIDRLIIGTRRHRFVPSQSRSPQLRHRLHSQRGCHLLQQQFDLAVNLRALKDSLKSWEYFISVTAQSLIYYIYVSVLLPENMWGQITCTAPFVLNHARVNPQAVL